MDGNAQPVHIQAVVARFAHEIGRLFDGAAFPGRQTVGVRRAAKQFERGAACQRRRDAFAKPEGGASDLETKGCHSDEPTKLFNSEHDSSKMNKQQPHSLNTADMESPWDNPRFRNWVAVARACHALERALTAKLAPLGLKPAQ